jgi:hypothetical protein
MIHLQLCLTMGICFFTTSCAYDAFIAGNLNDDITLKDYIKEAQLESLEKTFEELPIEVQSAVENSAKTIMNRQKSQLSEISQFISNTDNAEVDEIIKGAAGELVGVAKESLDFAKESANKQTPKQIEQYIINSTVSKIRHIHFKCKQHLEKSSRSQKSGVRN